MNRNPPVLREMILLLLVVVLGGGCGSSDTEEPATTTGFIVGVVGLADGAEPTGAVVTIGDRTETTDATGAFSFTEMPAGEYPLIAAHTGYTTLTGMLSVVAGQGTRADITLLLKAAGIPAAPVIDSLAITEGSDPLTPNGANTLSVSASDPNNDPLVYTWAIDNAQWTLTPAQETAQVQAPNRLGSSVTVTVTVSDGYGGEATDSIELLTTPCEAGFDDCDGDPSSGCEARSESGVGPLCAAFSCRRILLDGISNGSGVYWLDHGGEVAPYETYCEMDADSGGWSLLGTISGADDDHWAMPFGLWSNSSTLGSAAEPWLDFKSQAWVDFNIVNAEVMIQRRYGGAVQAQTVLENPCMTGSDRFVQLFQDYDASLACAPSSIQVLTHSPTGLSSGLFEEGVGAEGLGSPSTNGFCWSGEDTSSSGGFQAHLVWHGQPIIEGNSCRHDSLSAGVGVFNAADAPGQGDILATPWFGQSLDLGPVDVSLFARERAQVLGSLTDLDPGVWSDDSYAASCYAYRHPDPTFYEYSGTTGNGIYRIDPDGSGPIAPANVFCDMGVDGGGWTALAANGDNATAETTDPGDCYPLITNEPDRGCGNSGDLLNDFTLDGEVQGALQWRYLLAVVEGEQGYSNKLAFFSIDFGTSEYTSEERLNGAPYSPPGLLTTYGSVACGANFMAHYAKAGTYNAATDSVARDKGTVFGSSNATSMDSPSRETIGFTAASDDLGLGTSMFGVDSYNDGWGCEGAFSPGQVHGARMVILVR